MKLVLVWGGVVGVRGFVRVGVGVGDVVGGVDVAAGGVDGLGGLSRGEWIVQWQ